MMSSVLMMMPAFVWIVIGVAVWVAIVDFLYMRIPNAAHFVLFLVFLIFVFPRLPWTEVVTRLGMTGAVFAVALLLYLRGIMGAGDVKYLAVSAPFIPADLAILAGWLLVISIAGLPVFAVHRIVGLIAPGNRYPSFSEGGFFPYGPAISIGLVTVVVVTTMTD